MYFLKTLGIWSTILSKRSKPYSPSFKSFYIKMTMFFKRSFINGSYFLRTEFSIYNMYPPKVYTAADLI